MNWPLVPLEKLALPVKGSIKIGPFGSQLRRSDLSAAGVHVIGIENVLAGRFDDLGDRFISHEKFKELSVFEVRPGDLLLTMMGTVGEVAIVPPVISRSIIDSHLLRFTPNKAICLPEFVAWLIKSPLVKRAIHARAHGAIMKGLNSGLVKSILVPLPPLSAQHRIVEILDKADRLRKLRTEADAKAERIVPALFVKMFGDPETNPREWDTFALGDPKLTTHITSGSRGWSRYIGRGSGLFVRTQDIQDGEIAANLPSVDPPQGAEAERTRLAEGDVVVTITGIVGKAARYSDRGTPTFVSQHVALVRPVKERLNSSYLTAYANLPASGGVPILARRQYGQTKPGLGFAELKSAEIPVPPIKLQEEFERILSELNRVRAARNASREQVDCLWQCLLRDTFSGNLRGVHAVKAQLAEARR